MANANGFALRAGPLALIETVLRSHYPRFLGGGVICAGINNLILILGDHLGFGYVLLSLLGAWCSGSVGYFYHSRITFRHRLTLKGYVNFILGIALGLPISVLILAVLTDLMTLPMWIAAPVMTVLMVVYHYLIARLAITRRLVAARD